MRRRWTRSSRIYLAGSVGAAAVAGLIVQGRVAQVSATGGAAGPRVPVVVAARPLARGAAVDPSALRVVRIPSEFAPPGAIARIQQAAGRAALTDLAAGEVVTRTRLARVRAGPVASLVPQGLRAFAVPTSLPAGAVIPGDRIDVLGTFGAGGAGQPHTETVAEAVEVLLVIDSSEAGSSPGGSSGLGLDAGSAGSGATVTLVLLVSPQDEQRLAYARAFADLAVAIAPPPAAVGGP
jgi:pilus assembly protein CpaB